MVIDCSRYVSDCIVGGAANAVWVLSVLTVSGADIVRRSCMMHDVFLSLTMLAVRAGWLHKMRQWLGCL